MYGIGQEVMKNDQEKLAPGGDLCKEELARRIAEAYKGIQTGTVEKGAG